jgi:hypothetical protein
MKITLNKTSIISAVVFLAAAGVVYWIIISILSSTFERFRHGNADRYIPYSKMIKLQNLLEEQKLQEADRLTAEIILTAAGKLKTVPDSQLPANADIENKSINLSDVNSLPCQLILKINEIWSSQSKGKFGLSVQDKIWETAQVPGNKNTSLRNYIKEVGWQPAVTQVSSYPKGYFPFLAFSKNDLILPSLFDRFRSCQQAEFK